LDLYISTKWDTQHQSIVNTMLYAYILGYTIPQQPTTKQKTVLESPTP